MKQYDAIFYIKSSQYPGINNESEDFLGIISGLKASAGAVISSLKKNAIFVDGRYELVAKLAIDENKFSINSLSKKNIVDWIKTNLKPFSKLAFDSRFFSYKSIHYFKNELLDYQFVEVNFDELFKIHKEKRNSQIISLPNKCLRKFQLIYEIISCHELDGYLICDPMSIAWLLDKRDLKTKNTPVILGYLLITKKYKSILYLDDSYDIPEYRHISCLSNDISSLSNLGADFSEIPYFIKHNKLIDIKNPIPEKKCIKSNHELKNIMNVVLEDSAAIINFIYWFENNKSDISEMDCVNKIYELRKNFQNFVENSFDTIAAADEHSAIVHYSPSQETNKTIRNILLLDSGGQYKYGTTDITRTLSRSIPSIQEKLYYTLVLKGHIAIALAKLPKGSSGYLLDSLARQYLWNYNLDYNHSTGHGIGYMLNVHEGPIAISKNNQIPLKSNMVLSNEPGVYIENHLGIRLENMIVTKEENNFIYFDTISLVPFDYKFIEFSLLSNLEKLWLYNYNKKILSNKFLSNSIRYWLIEYLNKFI